MLSHNYITWPVIRVTPLPQSQDHQGANFVTSRNLFWPSLAIQVKETCQLSLWTYPINNNCSDWQTFHLHKLTCCLSCICCFHLTAWPEKIRPSWTGKHLSPGAPRLNVLRHRVLAPPTRCHQLTPQRQDQTLSLIHIWRCRRRG